MPKAKSNTLVAVEWLWSNRGKNIWWTPSVLAKGNPDPASPKLTDVEAISVFELLKEKELIIPSIHEGQPVFLLHEAKEIEWNNLISELGINRTRKTKTNAELASKTPKTNTAPETKLQWWVKTLLGAGGVGVIVVALIALLNRNSGQGNLGVQNSNSGPTFNTVGHSNTVYNSVTTVVANPSDEKN